MRTKKRAFPLKALLALLIIALGLSLTACFSDEEEGLGGGGLTAAISLSANPESIPADGASSSAIKAELRDSTGEAVTAGTSVAFSTDLGVFPNGDTTYTVTTSSDSGIATVSLMAGTTAGTAEITSNSNNVTQSIRVEFTSYTISLTADPERIPADGVSSSTITAEVTDAYGSPVPPGTSVDFFTTLGRFQNGATVYAVETPDETGVVSVFLISGTTIGEAIVTAQSHGVTKTAGVFFTGEGGPGDTAWITLTANPPSIPADGASSSAITAELKTSTGDPVPQGTAIRFATTLGRLSNSSTTTPDEFGKVTVSLISGTAAGTATVTAASGSVTQSATVEFTGEVIPPAASSLSLSLSQPTVKSDNSDKSTITAAVLDSNNAAIEGVTVTFGSDGGKLSKASVITDENGEAETVFSSGTTDKSNRVATITATVSGLVPKTIPVQVVGTTLTLSTDASILEIGGNNTATLTITARDAGGMPIYDAEITVTASPAGRVQLTPTTGNTDVTGKLQVQVTALTSGIDPVVVQAAGLGATGTQNYTIGAVGSVFNIIHPVTDPFSWYTAITVATVGPQIDITFTNSDPDTITSGTNFGGAGFTAGDRIMVVGSALNDGTYTIDPLSVPGTTLTLVASDQLTTEAAGRSVTVSTGVVVRVNAPDPITDVEFATTLGEWDGVAGGMVVPKTVAPNNQVEAVLTSADAGTATILVSDADDPSTSDGATVLFSAPSSQASQIALQANKTVVAPSTGGVTNSVTLRATVKNNFDQVVGGAPVAFSIQNPTGGGEYVSPPIVYTGSNGIAEATFTSGSLSTPSGGVTVRATLVDLPATFDEIAIVIGGTGGSVVITRGTTIDGTINYSTAYSLPMSVQVADANGNPMVGAIVTLNVWPRRYATGCWIINADGDWVPGDCDACNTYTFYPNEDINRNLILDPGEDIGPPGTDHSAAPCLLPSPNPDGHLTPPNSAAGTVPATVPTDANGVGEFNLVYGKGSAAWIEDEITATTLVYGTETKGTYIFKLPWEIGEEESLPHSPYNFAW